MILHRPASERGLETSTSSVLALRVVVDAFVAAGGKRGVLLRRIGVSADDLAHPDRRVPFDALLRAWELAPELLGDESFGLRMGERVPRGAFGLVEYAGRASATLGQALERLVELQRLLHDRARLSLHGDATTATISARIAGMPLGAPRHFNEATVAILLTLARQLTGVDIVPVEVVFQHAEPAWQVGYRRILRAPIVFGGLHTQLVLPASVIDLPLVEADPVLAEILLECGRQALVRLPPAADGMRICRELIASRLAAGEVPRIDYIAREVGVGSRSLQRTLAAHGLSFRDVVDDVRRELALAWATSSREPAEQLAYKLGYAGASAFHHAFRRWTGKTVTEWRNQDGHARLG